MTKPKATIDQIFKYAWDILKRPSRYFTYRCYSLSDKHVHVTPTSKLYTYLLRLEQYDEVELIRNILMIIHRPVSITKEPTNKETLEFTMLKR